MIDEAFNVSKGANSIISMLHFLNHGLEESSIHLHVDNCAKNRFMMYILPDMESSYWSAGGDEDVFPNSPVHNICTQLVLWSGGAAVLLN